jgi:hypothetical protein
MKKSLCYIALIWMVFSVCFSQDSGTSFSKVPMDYELYSWPGTGGDWNFCVRPNTNSEATVEQVFNKRTVLRSVAQLERRISELPAGAKVYWVDRIPSGKGPRAKGSESLTYPPADIRNQVRKYAEKHHVEVEVLSPLFNP